VALATFPRQSADRLNEADHELANELEKQTFKAYCQLEDTKLQHFHKFRMEVVVPSWKQHLLQSERLTKNEKEVIDKLRGLRIDPNPPEEWISLSLWIGKFSKRAFEQFRCYQPRESPMPRDRDRPGTEAGRRQ
jgi:hypothetical protein